MRKINPKISYDKEDKILSFQVGKEKGVDSDISGNVVIDYDKKGKIVKIDFYDFDFDEFKQYKKQIKSFIPHSKLIIA